MWVCNDGDVAADAVKSCRPNRTQISSRHEMSRRFDSGMACSRFQKTRTVRHWKRRETCCFRAPVLVGYRDGQADQQYTRIAIISTCSSILTVRSSASRALYQSGCIFFSEVINRRHSRHSRDRHTAERVPGRAPQRLQSRTKPYPDHTFSAFEGARHPLPAMENLLLIAIISYRDGDTSHSAPRDNSVTRT